MALSQAVPFVFMAPTRFYKSHSLTMRLKNHRQQLSQRELRENHNPSDVRLVVAAPLSAELRYGAAEVLVPVIPTLRRPVVRVLAEFLHQMELRLHSPERVLGPGGQ